MQYWLTLSATRYPHKISGGRVPDQLVVSSSFNNRKYQSPYLVIISSTKLYTLKIKRLNCYNHDGDRVFFELFGIFNESSHDRDHCHYSCVSTVIFLLVQTWKTGVLVISSNVGN
jgi:hypothetical protein